MKETLDKFSVEKIPLTIEPSRCIIEDLEVLAFETEEQLDYYSVWHDTYVDKRREEKAENERERQIIRNEIVRKTSQYLIGSYETSEEGGAPTRICSGSGDAGGNDESDIALAQPSTSKKSKTSPHSNQHNVLSQLQQTAPRRTSSSSSRRNRSSPVKNSRHAQRTNEKHATPSFPSPNKSPSRSNLAASRALAASVAARSTQLKATAPTVAHYKPTPDSPHLDNGLTILNSSHYNTLPSGKQLMKYKLTKLYNKYRGRQQRRNFVNEKYKNAKIEAEVSKSYLNSWLAYTALQALRLPETNINQLSTVTNHNTKFLTTYPTQAQSSTATSTVLCDTQQYCQQVKDSVQTGKASAQTNSNQQASTPNNPQPVHLLYIDPGNLITYSNKINPKQVADYRRHSHLLPISATSKKSSAASYDVYEIMEVLANTNKTNVTITRNANRPAQPGCSVYSHSVNANTPGIVSTQLHLQAKSYLDSMRKFYVEEIEKLDQEREALELEPSTDEQVGRYINIKL